MVRQLALAVMATCLASADVSLAKPPEPAVDRVRLFEWFSTLGYPDVKHAKFVTYPSGVSNSEGEPAKVWLAHGFLLGENKDAWTVLTIDLDQQQVAKKVSFVAKQPPDWMCHEQDLAAFANEALASTTKRDSGGISEFRRGGRSQTTRLFFLAWACWRRGLDEPAGRLFQLATDLRDRKLGFPPGNVTLRRRIAVDLAQQDFLEAQFDLCQRALPREKVLQRLESIPQKFPGIETAFLAQEMARVLEPMVREDREHAKNARLQRPFAELSRKEQVAELVFELRDQCGRSANFVRGRADIFIDQDRAGDSPAERLFKLGYEAVPQLIEALADERYTRTLGAQLSRRRRRRADPWSDFRHHVLTVGDCALQILERLACREFVLQSNSFLSESPTRIAAVKNAVLQWNEELQRDLKQKGERQVLVDRMQSADSASTRLAEPLLAKYPDAALPALAAAARKATDKSVMTEFVQLMERAGGKELIPALLDELKNSPSLDERITVATLLLKHQRSDGAVPLVEEWKRSAEHKLPSDTLVELAYYLAKCGKADAVTALAQGLDKRPTNLRLAAVRAFARNDALEAAESSSNFLVFFPDGEGGETSLPVNINDKVLFAEVADLLMGELQDTEPTRNGSGRWGEVSFSDPCVADVAAHVLHQLDAKRFPFDLSARRSDRDRQRVLLINAWRKTRHLPELPLPRPIIVAPVAEETLTPLLDRLQKAKADVRDAAERDVEKLGPGAVIGVLKRRDRLKPGDPLRNELERLAQHMAQTIVEIQFADKSLKPSGKLAARIDALKNKPLDTATLVELAVRLTNEMALPVHGCRLHVTRAGPGSGIALRVDLLDKARNNALHDGSRPQEFPQLKNGPVWWQNSLNAESNGRDIFGQSGSGPEIDREDLQSLGDAAFAIDVSKPLDLNIEYIGHWIE
jgi:hypothetical protein